MMKSKKTLFIVEAAILIAFVVLLSLPPFNLIRLGPAYVAFAPIPIIVGAVALGPKAGALLGTVFGLISFFTCFGLDMFGVALLAINPFYTFLVCVPTRCLMGLFTGLIASGMKHKNLGGFIVPSIAGPVMNTLFFTSTLFLLFWNAPIIAESRGSQTVFGFFIAFVGINAAIEAASCAIIATAVSKAVYHVNARQPR